MGTGWDDPHLGASLEADLDVQTEAVVSRLLALRQQELAHVPGNGTQVDLGAPVQTSLGARVTGQNVPFRVGVGKRQSGWGPGVALSPVLPPSRRFGGTITHA